MIALIIGALAFIGLISYLLLRNDEPRPIGGDRDTNGCLTSAGYAWSEEIGACVRGFELSTSTRTVAKQAVAQVGRAYALTVISVEESTCDTCYTVSLERGEDREPVEVEINTAVPSTRDITLYYYNPALDQGEGGAQCSRNGLVAVQRTIPRTQSPLRDALTLLLKGELTEAERARGITTEYPLDGVSLKNVTIQNGVATITLDDPEGKTGGGACRAGVLWFQIEATAKQFPSVESVRFLPEELFQP